MLRGVGIKISGIYAIKNGGTSGGYRLEYA